MIQASECYVYHRVGDSNVNARYKRMLKEYAKAIEDARYENQCPLMAVIVRAGGFNSLSVDLAMEAARVIVTAVDRMGIKSSEPDRYSDE